MDVENPNFQRSKLCRLCRKSSDNKTPISQLHGQQQVPLSQLIASCLGIQIYDFDRLPQHICAKCIRELDQAYSTQVLCISSGPPAAETIDARCRMCSLCDIEELISTNRTTKDGCDQIDDVFRIFTGDPPESDCGQERFLCSECCSQLELSFAFRNRCLQTQTAFADDYGQPWEKMEFQTEEPTRLVVEPRARILFQDGDPNFGKCSVCLQPQFSGQTGNACRGCLLEFSNAFKTQSNLQNRIMERINGKGSSSSLAKESQHKIEMNGLKKLNSTSNTEETQCQRPISTNYFRNFLAMHSLSLEETFPTLEEFPLYLKVQRKIPMCDDCNEFFPSEDALIEHCSLKHVDKEQLICDTCVTCFISVKPFRQHIQADQHGIYEYCKLCKRILSTGQVLRHLTVSHVAQWKEFVKQQESATSTDITQSSNTSVETTSRKSISTKYFKNFMSTHSLSLEEVFPALEDFPMYSRVQRKVPMCDGCSEFFPSEDALAEHWAQKHVKRKQLVCDTCPTYFNTASACQRHLQAGQHDIHDYCKLCKRILLSGQIERHLMLSHVSQWKEFKKQSQDVVETPPKAEIAPVETIDDAAMECDYIEDVDTLALKESEFMETMDSGTEQDALTQTEVKEPCPTSVPKERTTDSAAPIPSDSFRMFLQQSGLELRELFDVVEDNRYALILRRKIPLCCGCDQLFLNERARQNHIQMIHRQKIPAKHTCHECLSAVGSKNMNQRHVTKLTKQLLHGYCKECDKLFSSPRILIYHLFDIHFDETKQLEIESMFRQASRCDTNNYICRIGNCTFTGSRTETVLHCLRVLHTDSPISEAYPVPVDTLNDLFETIEDDAGLPYTKVRRKGPMCCECDTFFLTLTDLDEHRTVVHEKIESDCTFRCGFCSKVFVNQESLDLHNQKREATTYDYCRQCEVVLLVDSYEQHEMKQHPLVTELAERIEESFAMYPEILYKCCVPTCNTRHDTSEELLKHFESVHQRSSTSTTIEQMCPYCGVCFRSNKDLIEHRSRQSELVLYTCKSKECTFFTYDRAQMYDHGTLCAFMPQLKAQQNSSSNLKVSRKNSFFSYRFVKDSSMDELIDVVKPNGMLCCSCDTVWNSEMALQRHVVEKHPVIKNNHQFQCSTCKRGFAKHGLLVRHRANKGKRYFCRQCKIQLLNLAQVTHHKLYVHPFGEPTELSEYYEKKESDGYPCCGCDQQFSTMDDLAEHCSQSHPARNTPKQQNNECGKCHQSFTVKQLISHANVYGNKIVYKCKLRKCDYVTTSLHAIEHHVSKISHVSRFILKPDKLTKYCCVKRCNFGSSCYEDIVEHAKSEHEDVRKNYRTRYSHKPLSCPTCCKGCDNETQLENHRRMEKRPRCKICGRECRNMDTHAAKCGRSCAKCGEKFKNRPELRKHMRDVHDVKKAVHISHMCNVCGKSVTDLLGHMEIHYNKRAWECPQCNARFNSKETLNSHAHVHSNVKLFVCRRGCQKSYKHRIDRDRHEKLVHTGDLPHKCTLCADAFVRDRDLRLHMRKHTGRKLYACSRCFADFDKISELTDHNTQCFAVLPRKFRIVKA